MMRFKSRAPAMMQEMKSESNIMISSQIMEQTKTDIPPIPRMESSESLESLEEKGMLHIPDIPQIPGPSPQISPPKTKVRPAPPASVRVAPSTGVRPAPAASVRGAPKTKEGGNKKAPPPAKIKKFEAKKVEIKTFTEFLDKVQVNLLNVEENTMNLKQKSFPYDNIQICKFFQIISLIVSFFYF